MTSYKKISSIILFFLSPLSILIFYIIKNCDVLFIDHDSMFAAKHLWEGRYFEYAEKVTVAQGRIFAYIVLLFYSLPFLFKNWFYYHAIKLSVFFGFIFYLKNRIQIFLSVQFPFLPFFLLAISFFKVQTNHSPFLGYIPNYVIQIILILEYITFFLRERSKNSLNIFLLLQFLLIISLGEAFVLVIAYSLILMTFFNKREYLFSTIWISFVWFSFIFGYRFLHPSTYNGNQLEVTDPFIIIKSATTYIFYALPGSFWLNTRFRELFLETFSITSLIFLFSIVFFNLRLIFLSLKKATFSKKTSFFVFSCFYFMCSFYFLISLSSKYSNNPMIIYVYSIFTMTFFFILTFLFLSKLSQSPNKRLIKLIVLSFYSFVLSISLYGSFLNLEILSKQSFKWHYLHGKEFQKKCNKSQLSKKLSDMLQKRTSVPFYSIVNYSNSHLVKIEESPDYWNSYILNRLNKSCRLYEE